MIVIPSVFATLPPVTAPPAAAAPVTAPPVTAAPTTVAPVTTTAPATTTTAPVAVAGAEATLPEAEPAAAQEGDLAVTGSSNRPLLAVGVALIGLGAAMVLLPSNQRRRR